MIKVKKNIIIFAVFLTTFSIAILGIFVGQNQSSKRSDFPILHPSPAYILKDSSFEELIDISEVLVECEVARVHSIETREFIPEPGTQEAMAYEKMGITSSFYKILKIDMIKKECVKGNIDEFFTLSVVALNLDSAPDFKIGDRFIMALKEYIDGSYTNVTSVSSYFFIANDDKVYPAGEDPWAQRFSGMNLSEFKQEIIEAI